MTRPRRGCRHPPMAIRPRGPEQFRRHRPLRSHAVRTHRYSSRCSRAPRRSGSPDQRPTRSRNSSPIRCRSSPAIPRRRRRAFRTCPSIRWPRLSTSLPAQPPRGSSRGRRPPPVPRPCWTEPIRRSPSRCRSRGRRPSRRRPRARWCFRCETSRRASRFRRRSRCGSGSAPR